MNKGKPCTLGSNNEDGGEVYLQLMDILQQAQSLGLNPGRLNSLTPSQDDGGSPPLDVIAEHIKRLRHELYQHMMDFELLERDLVELQSAVEKPESCSPSLATAYH